MRNSFDFDTDLDSILAEFNGADTQRNEGRGSTGRTEPLETYDGEKTFYDDRTAGDGREYDAREYDAREYDAREYDGREYDAREYDDRAYDNRGDDVREYDDGEYDYRPVSPKRRIPQTSHTRSGSDRSREKGLYDPYGGASSRGTDRRNRGAGRSSTAGTNSRAAGTTVREASVRKDSHGAVETMSRRPDRREKNRAIMENAGKAANGVRNFVLTFTGLVFGALALIVLSWMLVHVHPDSSLASSRITSKNRANVVSQLDSYANNAKGELLSELVYIRKHYLIPEGDLVAPKAPTYNYGTTDDPKEVLAVIEEARGYGLLDGQNVIFNENVDFYYDSDIEYYCDETLLVICWKELIENRICSCVEVKIADGSQLRRKLAEDTYGSSTYVYATELASQCNAVVAMNADYYAFRDIGITVYNRKLQRCDEGTYNGQYCKYNAGDSLLIDSSGDFHIFHKGDISTRKDMERYVAENNIMFSVAFGPVLVEDGQQVWCDWYPVGEVDKEYSRAGIAQCDQLHYLYMTVSFADNQNEYHPRCTVNEFAAIIAGKGVKTAYCLDGGQTGEVVFRGKPYNHIDYGTERTVSDIIYFATAIPESER